MAQYVPPVEDIGFLLSELFNFDTQMAALEGFEEVDTDLAVSIMEEAGKFCCDVLEPLNRSSDEEGCRLENGVVITPQGMAEAYRDFVAAGWGGLSGDPRFGGQGLPRILQMLLDEMLSSAHMSFGLFPGLTRGAVEGMALHACDALKAVYMTPMTTGEWTGAMALTEAHAGTDLGLLKTRAEPAGDGSYRLTGTKIFISSGDHEFTENIVHLVLARLPDAPAGVKGISLFLAPKYIPDASGKPGARNGISVGSLEHKMGIHAQPTCMIHYDGAASWLVGEPGRGLNAMFTMMNAERLFVGIQGLGIAEAANQKAAAYAKERLQGRSMDGKHGPVPILDHADVRRMLLEGRAFVDAGRALAVWTALQMDVAERHPDATTRKDADGFVALMTPVIKAAFTDMGFETAVTSQQVFGGHGYIRETGAEQFVRDSRIAQIYEGTNGVQAMDLAGRKLPMEEGRLAHRFFALVRADLTAALAVAGARDIAMPVLDALARLETTTDVLLARAPDTAETGAAAVAYLRFFALVSLGWMWALTVVALCANEMDGTPMRRRKRAAARFFVERILPQTLALDIAILNGASSLMALDSGDF